MDEVIVSCDKAIVLKPNYAPAHFNRGDALTELTRYEEALESYDRGLELQPDRHFAFGDRLHTRMKICEWSKLGGELAELHGKLGRGEKASSPFGILSQSGSRAIQRKVADMWIADLHPANSSMPALAKRPRREKIRIGYFSANFHQHPGAQLIVELIERHDRSRFDVIGFSFGIDSADEMRKRLVSAFDRFIEVRNRSDREVALLARELEIDIAVDLRGFTKDSRTSIFAHRAAPVQVNYLGYPGTMGAAYMDYLVGDPVVIPAAHRADYAEKIVRLPDSYQPNDTRRRISERVFRRSELGLPETGFVYCCFNNNYKITPDVFDLWMKILGAVPGSVLWLLEDKCDGGGEPAAREAERRGVPGGSVAFAPRMALAEHLVAAPSGGPVPRQRQFCHTMRTRRRATRCGRGCRS